MHIVYNIFKHMFISVVLDCSLCRLMFLTFYSEHLLEMMTIQIVSEEHTHHLYTIYVSRHNRSKLFHPHNRLLWIDVTMNLFEPTPLLFVLVIVVSAYVSLRLPSIP